MSKICFTPDQQGRLLGLIADSGFADSERESLARAVGLVPVCRVKSKSAPQQKEGE